MKRLLRPFRWLWQLWVRIVTSGGIVLLGAVIASASIGGAYALTWALWPRVAFLLTTHVLCVLVGLAWRDARRTRTADVADYLGEEVEAIKVAERKRDPEWLPLSKRTVVVPRRVAVVEPADGEAIEIEPWINQGSPVRPPLERRRIL